MHIYIYTHNKSYLKKNERHGVATMCRHPNNHDSLAKEPNLCRALLKRRPNIVRSLLVVATP